MTSQLSNFFSNYARALLYSDLKRNRYRIVCRTAVTGAVLFRSESKGSGFHAIERP